MSLNINILQSENYQSELNKIDTLIASIDSILPSIGSYCSERKNEVAVANRKVEALNGRLVQVATTANNLYSSLNQTKNKLKQFCA